MSKQYIATTLKKLRNQSGLTIYQVGDIIGKSGKTISAWENNYAQPDIDSLMKLGEVYNTKNIFADFQEARQETMDTLFSSKKETELLNKYRRLTPHAQEIVNCIIDKELELQKRNNS